MKSCDKLATVALDTACCCSIGAFLMSGAALRRFWAACCITAHSKIYVPCSSGVGIKVRSSLKASSDGGHAASWFVCLFRGVEVQAPVVVVLSAFGSLLLVLVVVLFCFRFYFAFGFSSHWWLACPQFRQQWMDAWMHVHAR